jgi:hypothetical protein
MNVQNENYPKIAPVAAVDAARFSIGLIALDASSRRREKISWKNLETTEERENCTNFYENHQDSFLILNIR